METQETKHRPLINGLYHKQILYITRYFEIPVLSTFCGAKREGEHRTYRLNGEVTCPVCAKMTLEDAISKMEERIRRKEKIV